MNSAPPMIRRPDPFVRCCDMNVALPQSGASRLAAWDQFALESTPFVLRWLQAEFELSFQDWLLLHDAYTDEVAGVEGRLLALVLTALRRTFHDFLDHRHAQMRDARKTVSGDAPVSPEDPEGTSRWEELEAETRQRYEDRRKAVAERLEDALRDYPDQDEKRAYLEWFWSKADADLTDPVIAEDIGMTHNGLRHIRDKVGQYLRRRRKNDPEFLDCPRTP